MSDVELGRSNVAHHQLQEQEEMAINFWVEREHSQMDALTLGQIYVLS